MQLTISAQTDIAQPVGRLTFRPVVGGSGTLLTAGWPADQLLPHLKAAERLNFFGPDQHLIRSVRLSGGAEAVSSFQRCIDSPSSGQAGSASVSPAQDQADYVGWVPLFRPDICAISHITTSGNELSFLLQRDGKLDVAYQSRTKRSAKGREVITINFLLKKAGVLSAASSDDSNISMMIGKPGDHMTLVGGLTPSILFQLKTRAWDYLQLETIDGRPEVNDKVELLGANPAVRGMEKCAQTLK